VSATQGQGTRDDLELEHNPRNNRMRAADRA
jgi:hypothetical protein